MDTLRTYNGKPVDPTVSTSQFPVTPVGNPTVTTSAVQTHAAACGEVGETGVHGDIGENAAK